MQISFNTILVPVDFSRNTGVAIKKALALSEGSDAAIHLLHVSRISSGNINRYMQYMGSLFHGKEMQENEIRNRMLALVSFIREARRDIDVFSWIIHAYSVERSIIDKAKKIAADLTIIGKTSYSRLHWLNTVMPDRIAKQGGVEVLTVNPGAIHDQIKTIVVPVEGALSDKKLAIIQALSRKFRVHICLAAWVDGETDQGILPNSLLQAYRLLKTGPLNKISYELLPGHSRVKAILKYCLKVNADLLIVDPGGEPKIWELNKYIPDVLHTDDLVKEKSVPSFHFEN
jgi:nucleotide-binding universal stress UspA family protein